RIGSRTLVLAGGGAGDVDVAEPGSPPLYVPPGAFAQVGAAANAALVQAVLEAVGDDPGPVLELHAGSGNFTRHPLGASASVVALDLMPQTYHVEVVARFRRR